MPWIPDAGRTHDRRRVGRRLPVVLHRQAPARGGARAARARRSPDCRVEVRWHPFQLNPELPREGIDRRATSTAKFGGPERAAQIYERVRAAGREAGHHLRTSTPSSGSPTRSMRTGWSPGRSAHDGDADATWSSGCSAPISSRAAIVGDRVELARIAGEAGYRRGDARAMLDSAEGRDDGRRRGCPRARAGHQGVPFFMFDGRMALSGAHEPALVAAIAQARDSEQDAEKNEAGDLRSGRV